MLDYLEGRLPIDKLSGAERGVAETMRQVTDEIAGFAEDGSAHIECDPRRALFPDDEAAGADVVARIALPPAPARKSPTRP